LTLLYLRLPSRAAASAHGRDTVSGFEPTDAMPDLAVVPCQFAVVADNGAIEQQGDADAEKLAGLVPRVTRVVLLLAASDVTLLDIVVPPMSAARLRTALPNLIEDQLIGDVAECAFVAGPSVGGKRTVAVVGHAWLAAWAAHLRALGAGQLSALPAQLCLPWAGQGEALAGAGAGGIAGAAGATGMARVAEVTEPAGDLPGEAVPQASVTTAAIAIQGAAMELSLRLSATEGLGLTIMAQASDSPDMPSMTATAGDVLDALLALVPGRRVMALVPAQEQALFEFLLREREVTSSSAAGAGAGAGAGAVNAAGILPQVDFIADSWTPWIAGATTIRLDLMAGLGRASTQQFNWRPWRWPVLLGLLLVLFNAGALNYEWWRLAREASTLRAAMTQIYRAAYPTETVIVDPVAQMAQKIALGKRDAGQAGPDDFATLAAKFGEAWSSLAMEPATRNSIAALDYRERALYVRLKAGTSSSSAQTSALRAALAGRGLALSNAPGQTSATVWHIHPQGK
jgi:general secretion pathway protein L